MTCNNWCITCLVIVISCLLYQIRKKYDIENDVDAHVDIEAAIIVWNGTNNITAINTSHVLQKCIDNPHYATQFRQSIPYWPDPLPGIDTKEVQYHIQTRLNKDEKSVNVTWVNDERSFIDKWQSFIISTSSASKSDNEIIWVLNNDTFFNIFSKNVANYQNNVLFYDIQLDSDVHYMFHNNTTKKQFFYVNLTNITHHDVSHIFLNNKNAVKNISICLEPNDWRQDWKLSSFMKKFQNNNSSFNIVIDEQREGYLDALHQISKYKDTLNFEKSNDPRFKDTMARIPLFNVWLRQSADIDKYSTLLNERYELEPSTVFEMIINPDIRDKIHFVDARGWGGRNHGDGVLFKDKIDSDFINETVTSESEIMNKIGSSMVRDLENITHVIFFCDHSHSRGPGAATAYLHHLREIFPYSTQKVCILKGGMLSWNGISKWNKRLKQFYDSQLQSVESTKK